MGKTTSGYQGKQLKNRNILDWYIQSTMNSYCCLDSIKARNINFNPDTD